MAVKAVLFDLDGVLVFSREAWFHLLNATARRFGSPPVTRDQFEGAWGQGIQADVEQFFPQCTEEEIEAFFHAHFLDQLAQIELEPDGQAVFAALQRAGIAIAVVSNTPASTVRAILGHAGLEPRVVVGGTDVPQAKPAPDMVLLALEKLALTPGEAIMVGDTRYDAQAARAAGVPFVGYGLPDQPSITRLREVLPHAGVEAD